MIDSNENINTSIHQFVREKVNLTSPEILLFREEMPEDKTMRNYYLELQSHRQAYKRAFIDPQLWVVLSGNLGKLLRKEFDERSEDDRMVIERILILARNILQVVISIVTINDPCNNFDVNILQRFHEMQQRKIELMAMSVFTIK